MIIGYDGEVYLSNTAFSMQRMKLAEMGAAVYIGTALKHYVENKQ